MRVLAQQFYQVYPARPNPNIAMRTIATHNFFYVLDGAPSAPGRNSQTWGTDVQGLEFVQVGAGPDGLYEWNETYLERLFTEVNGLVTRFGLGDAGGGWQTIRWVIYDKVRLTLLIICALANGISFVFSMSSVSTAVRSTTLRPSGGPTTPSSGSTSTSTRPGRRSCA